MTNVADEKYVSLTTYRKDGTSSAVPTWICDFGDGTVGLTTASSSLKTKRIANDPRVQLQGSDSRGKLHPGSTPITGTAKVVTGPDFVKYRTKVAKKYGLMYKMVAFAGKVAKVFRRGSGIDTAIVITLDEGQGEGQGDTQQASD